MAAPVATARTLNGVQDTPIDSDNAPYYRAKTGIILPFGFAGAIVAQVPFVSRATRADVDPIAFVPQGLFVGAFVKQATRADILVTGLAGTLVTSVAWLPFAAVQIDRTLPFPQYVTGIRSGHLVDPGGVVTSVEMIDKTVDFTTITAAQSEPSPVSLTVGRDGTIQTVYFTPVSQDWAHPKSTTVGDLFEAKLTAVSGTTPTGAAMATYLSLTSARIWTVAASGLFTGTLVIRRVGGADLCTATVTMSGG